VDKQNRLERRLTQALTSLNILDFTGTKGRRVEGETLKR